MKRINLMQVIHQSTEFRSPLMLPLNPLLNSDSGHGVCSETKEGNGGLTAASLTKFYSCWVRKETWLQSDPEPTAALGTHTNFSNKVSQEVIIGTDFFSEPPCGFMIYCTIKWFFPLGNKAPNISQWNVNTQHFLSWRHFFRNMSNTEWYKYK